jgi:hypothetical protein
MTQHRRTATRHSVGRWVVLTAFALFVGFHLSLPTWEVVLDGGEPTYCRSWWWRAPFPVASLVCIEQSICWVRSVMPPVAAIALLWFVRRIPTSPRS